MGEVIVPKSKTLLKTMNLGSAAEICAYTVFILVC